ncbi:hypothetical protein BU26DRAFT_553429 [Trematosphaeria pertusa]|uniref:Uncharacterized protein n=1 Tax=Trematosphaeria pertusa TaxID=390896 RepID=A0A6A6I4W4_9PLEO|nr:uncharacterized protein BU26DRAFT_553429 [Trematosphaeria pertusa]KAF2245574.1 hypothetical protein BU26DRAFT_553429 [Trematosphaeria pertusa]
MREELAKLLADIQNASAQLKKEVDEEREKKKQAEERDERMKKEREELAAKLLEIEKEVPTVRPAPVNPTPSLLYASASCFSSTPRIPHPMGAGGKLLMRNTSTQSGTPAMHNPPPPATTFSVENRSDSQVPNVPKSLA